MGDRAKPKRGAKPKKERSLAAQLRYQKVYEAEVPITRLLDKRASFSLDDVIDPKKKVRQARQKARGEEQNNEAAGEDVERSEDDPATTQVLADLQAQMSKMGSVRDPAEANPLLIGEPGLRKFVMGLTPKQRDDAARRVRSRVQLITEALRRKYEHMHVEMDKRGVFHSAANKKRSHTMLQVELRRLRLDVVEADVLEEMQYESKKDEKEGDAEPVLLTNQQQQATKKSRRRRAPKPRRRPSMSKDEMEERWDGQLDVFPSHVRTRALGRSATCRTLGMMENKLRHSKPLGQFLAPMSKEQKIRLQKPWRRRRSRDIAAEKKAQQEEEEDKPELDPHAEAERVKDEALDEASAALDQAWRQRAEAKSKERAARAADNEKRIQRAWKRLEVPMSQQLDFVCKYSNPEVAPMLRDMIPHLVICAGLVETRERLLTTMFKLQKNPKLKLSYEEALHDETTELLHEHNCWIDPVDLFGMPTFVRLSKLVRLVSQKCLNHCEDIMDNFGEVITYRGADYVKTIEAAAEVEAAWASFRGDWRTMPMPGKSTYQSNTFLRRLGEQVA